VRTAFTRTSASPGRAVGAATSCTERRPIAPGSTTTARIVVTAVLLIKEGIGNLNHFFSDRSHIAGPASCQSHFFLMKILVCLRPARSVRRSDARELLQIAPLVCVQ